MRGLLAALLDGLPAALLDGLPAALLDGLQSCWLRRRGARSLFWAGKGLVGTPNIGGLAVRASSGWVLT